MKINILFLLFFASFLLQAQENYDKLKIKDMHVRKWEYIVEKVKLTSQDAEKAQPIFMEYEQAVWKLMEKNRPFFMANKNKENTKTNFKEINDRYINIEIQKAHLLKSYYQKLEKVVSDEIIFKMGNAERSFRKDLVKDWQGKHNHKRK
jgi:hypothetical protein